MNKMASVAETEQSSSVGRGQEILASRMCVIREWRRGKVESDQENDKEHSVAPENGERSLVKKSCKQEARLERQIQPGYQDC